MNKVDLINLKLHTAQKFLMHALIKTSILIKAQSATKCNSTVYFVN